MKCDALKQPLGWVRSSGVAALQVRAGGRADTASIIVTDIAAGTPAGLRSALQRQLPACSIKLTAPIPDAWYSFSFSWQGDSLLADDPRTLEARPMIPALDPPLDASLEVVADSANPEELPRALKCTVTRTVQVRTRVDGQLLEPKGIRRDPARGEVQLEYTVTPEGKVDPGSIRLIGPANAEVATGAATALGTCQFAPGREQGVPVRTRMRSTERL